MGVLPTGTVTFLLTDVEGSTALWEREPAAMQQAAARHDALIEATVSERGGVVVRPRGEGDSRFAVFSRASDAVAAALALQWDLEAEPWPTSSPLRVRLALHTGEAELRDGDYYGTAVNRCARLRAVAHGGQVLMSQATVELVGDRVPPATLLDLGEHRLRDLVRADHIYQLVQPGVPATFPPLRSLDTLPNNLPLQLTSFVGREHEVVEVGALLAAHRLVTLTGVGGGGKTRLAQQVAADVIDAHPDGVWFVDLAPLTDPELVARTVASVLGIVEQPGQAIEATLLTALRTRRLLLILDNCEHLLDACAALTEALLKGCPSLRLLATSREALGSAGEVPWRIPSLATPDPDQLPPLDELVETTAVRLFVERVRVVQPAFAVTDQNAAAVARVCRRLDGIPLALELAAARPTVLTVEQIAARLDDRFRLLTGGRRTALRRQQTLAAALDWSHDLLTAPERVLLRQLAVFAGGFTLDAAEAVAAAEDRDTWQVLDLLTRLVAKSLVVVEAAGAAARYRLLETVRQYAGEKLAASDEAVAVRDRHRDWFLAVAERAATALEGPAIAVWLARLETEHDNLRAALEWSLDSDPARGLRLAACLWQWWQGHGHYAEGRQWLERTLAGAPEPTEPRARALLGAGQLARDLGDPTTARARFEAGLTLSRSLGDRRLIAWALHELAFGLMLAGDDGRAQALLEEGLVLSQAAGDRRGLGRALMLLGRLAERGGDSRRAWALFEESVAVLRAAGDWVLLSVALGHAGGAAIVRGDDGRARALFEEALAMAQDRQSPQGIASYQWMLGRLAHWQGDAPRAVARFEASLALARRVDHKDQLAWSLAGLGRAVHLGGDGVRATELLEESLALYTELGDKRGISDARYGLAVVALAQGDPARAMQFWQESLALRREVGERPDSVECLEGLAEVAVARGQPGRAARLLGAATVLREAIGAPLPPVDRPGYEATMAAVRAALGEASFAVAWAEGEALPLEEAVAYALAEEEPDVMIG